MRLVQVHQAGEMPHAGAPLSPREYEALLVHYRDGVARDSQAWFARLRADRLWIVCHCRPARAAPPLMFIRRTQAGAYVLARMADRPRHAVGCPFERPAALPDAQDAPESLPRAARLFFAWWDAASLHQLLPYESADVLHAQYQALHTVSRCMALEPGQSLYEFSRTHPQGLLPLLRHLRAVAVGAGGASRAVYFTLAEDLDPRALAVSLCHAVPESPFELTDWELPEITRLAGVSIESGPYAVLYQFLAPCGGVSVRVESVFAQPVYSREKLVPVDGPLERQTLRLLLEVQRELLRAQTIVRIRKLLPDTTSHDRGINFAVERLGPNGRALRTISVLCAQGSSAPEGIAASQDVLYHWAGTCEADTCEGDSAFKRRLVQSLLQGSSVGPRAVGTGASDSLYIEA